MSKDAALPKITPHIAIIDEDVSVRRTAGMLIEDKKWTYAEFDQPSDFLRNAQPTDFSCLVIDVQVSNMSGMELFDKLIQDAKDHHLYLPPTLFLSRHGDISMAVRLLHQGAIDFLEKPVASDKLINAIQTAVEMDVTNRETFIAQYDLMEEMRKLTYRERQVLTGILAGSLSKQIAQYLSISPKTVEAHRLRICQKFKIRTAMELAAKLNELPASAWQVEIEGLQK
jgi:two-component system response regulator DctR